jgi:hypothetical protein
MVELETEAKRRAAVKALRRRFGQLEKIAGGIGQSQMVFRSGLALVLKRRPALATQDGIGVDGKRFHRGLSW